MVLLLKITFRIYKTLDKNTLRDYLKWGVYKYQCIVSWLPWLCKYIFINIYILIFLIRAQMILKKICIYRHIFNLFKYFRINLYKLISFIFSLSKIISFFFSFHHISLKSQTQSHISLSISLSLKENIDYLKKEVIVSLRNTWDSEVVILLF